MALEPITRQEKIIAGQDLTPITRLEKFLKEYGGSGGGGGGGADDVYTVKQITNYGTGEKELQGDYAGAMAAYQIGKKLKFVDAFNFNGQESVIAESFSYTFGQSGEIIFVAYQNYNFITYELTESGVTGRSDTYIKSLHVDAAGSFFLKSNSDKQFRVIVSDTGELSTEEVT